MSFWLVVILRGKRLPGKVLGLILGSRKCAKLCIMIKNTSQGDAWLARLVLRFGLMVWAAGGFGVLVREKGSVK